MKTILIIETTRVPAQIMVEALRNHVSSIGYPMPRVFIEVSFEDAINQIKSKEIEVVSSAMVFPRKYGETVGSMMGNHLAFALRRDYPKIPVIIFSAEEIRVNTALGYKFVKKAGPESYKEWAEAVVELLGK